MSHDPKHFPEPDILDSGKCFRILGVVFGFCESVFEFWEVSWIMESVLSLRATELSS